jgi:hypothetical protein
MKKDRMKSPAMMKLSAHDAERLDRAIESRSAGGSILRWVGLSGSKADGRVEGSDSRLVSQVFQLLDRFPVATPREDLLERTLERVDQTKRKRRFSFVSQDMGVRSGTFGWFESVALAAVVVVGVSIAWPMLQRSRENARRIACSENLGAVGAAINQYANDFDRRMPRGHIVPGSVWWNVGQQGDPGQPVESNSAHIFRLVRLNYIDPSLMNCPDNPHANKMIDAYAQDWPDASSVSYSYQNQFTARRTRLDTAPEMTILADKNPLFEDMSGDSGGLGYRRDLPASTLSNFHSSLGGQNMLTLSGRVLWSTTPDGPNGDNIWTIRGMQDYTGREVPQDLDDSFLVP